MLIGDSLKVEAEYESRISRMKISLEHHKASFGGINKDFLHFEGQGKGKRTLRVLLK
jgi:hypothetical protein